MSDVRALMNMDVVVVLGNFHTQMSFLGSIGYVITRSGFAEALEMIFGDKTVQSIMKDKNYARSMRAHGLMATTLKKLLVEALPEDAAYATEAVCDIFYSITENNDTPLDLASLRQSPAVTHLTDQVETVKERFMLYGIDRLAIEYINPFKKPFGLLKSSPP